MRARCRDIDVAWFEAGRGDPLVLVHGLADDHRAWRKTLPDLMLRHRVVLYDLRGHGETSLGGTIAMRAAIDHPERVRGLALVATSSRVGRAAADWYRQRVEMVERGDSSLREMLDRDTADVYAESPNELEEALLIRRQSTADPRGYGNACAAMAGLNASPLDPELPRIEAPTLIVASDRDQHCPPKAAEIIAAGIKGARLEVFAEAGHPIPVEKPCELARAINSFL